MADDGVLGKQLWISDGTAAGTHVVKFAPRIESDAQTQELNWDSTSVSPTGVSVTVKKGATTIYTAANASGSFNYDSYGTGIFTTEVYAVGSSGEFLVDRQIVSVIDDSAEPTVSLLGSSGRENPMQLQDFAWDVDASAVGVHVTIQQVTSQGSFVIYDNPAAAHSGSFNFDSYGLGDFTITVAASDADSDWTGDASSTTATRQVTVYPTLPLTLLRDIMQHGSYLGVGDFLYFSAQTDETGGELWRSDGRTATWHHFS